MLARLLLVVNQGEGHTECEVDDPREPSNGPLYRFREIQVVLQKQYPVRGDLPANTALARPEAVQSDGYAVIWRRGVRSLWPCGTERHNCQRRQS